MEPKVNLFLDLDGVLADFDTAAHKALGGECHYRYDFIHGGAALWARLHSVPNFFATFGLMPGAMGLWRAVRHLNPTILTALPKTDPAPVAAQKMAWVRNHLGQNVRVITCATLEKPNYCSPTDILVDDRTVNRQRWNARGGRFVQHVTAAETLRHLRNMEIIA